MPTAAQYETLARRFEAQAAHLERLVRPVTSAFTADVITGPVATTIDLAVQATAANAAACARQLRGLADTCSERARVCRWYSEAMRQYRATLIGPGASTTTTRPVRPAPWAEAG